MISPEVGLTPDILRTIPELIPLAIALLGMAYSKAQKEWFKERDKKQCQFPVKWSDGSYTPCGRKKRLQLHHAIMPQRFGQEHGYSSEDLDVPENGIYLCEDHHAGVVHNDMLVARLAYGKNKAAYEQAFKERDETIASGEKYWNTRYDWLFYRIIQALNGRMDKPYPYSRKQEKKLENGGLRGLPTVTKDHDGRNDL